MKSADIVISVAVCGRLVCRHLVLHTGEMWSDYEVY